MLGGIVSIQICLELTVKYVAAVMRNREGCALTRIHQQVLLCLNTVDGAFCPIPEQGTEPASVLCVETPPVRLTNNDGTVWVNTCLAFNHGYQAGCRTSSYSCLCFSHEKLKQIQETYGKLLYFLIMRRYTVETWPAISKGNLRD